MITLPGEFGNKCRPPFLEGGELSPELFQLPVDLRQFGPRLPLPQASLTSLGPDQVLDLAAEQSQPRVPVHRGGPVLELARVDRREDLLLRQPVLRASRLVAQRRALTSPFFGAEFLAGHYLPGQNLSGRSSRVYRPMSSLRRAPITAMSGRGSCA
jgi:hypothetical protein